MAQHNDWKLNERLNSLLVIYNAICRIYRNFFKRQAKNIKFTKSEKKTLCSRCNEEEVQRFVVQDQTLQERDL